MKSVSLLTDNRLMSKHFNKKAYPDAIDRLCRQIEAYLTEIGGDDFDAELLKGVDGILDEVQANMDRHMFGFRKNSVFADDHIILSLFVVPAAAKLGTPAAQKFCELLSTRFTERFPGTTFKIGNYEEILEGFRSRIAIFSKR